MKAPKEIRKWMNAMRKRHGKKNGVIPGYLLDSPKMMRKWANSKRETDWGKPQGREVW